MSTRVMSRDDDPNESPSQKRFREILEETEDSVSYEETVKAYVDALNSGDEAMAEKIGRSIPLDIRLAAQMGYEDVRDGRPRRDAHDFACELAARLAAWG